MTGKKLIFLGVAAAVAASACGKKSEPPPPPAPAAAPSSMPGAPGQMPPAGMQGAPGQMPPAGMPSSQPAMPPVPRTVSVPDDVKKTWKSVVLALTDKKANKTEDLKVDIGQTAKKGDLEITVESFLPAFTMGGGAITSKSNNPENPAAKVVVKEKGNQIYAGWLFSLYPNAHPMQHEKWGLALKDFVKK